MQILFAMVTNMTKNHKFGTCNFLFKKNDLYNKFIPLLSYFNNRGRDLFIVVGRAGYFLLRKFIPSQFNVNRISEVISNFSTICRDFNENDFMIRLKIDIDNFPLLFHIF